MPEMAAACGAFGDEWSEIGALFDMISERPVWHKWAACRTAPASVSWFPGPNDDTRAAMAVCAGCPAVASCSTWAIAEGPSLKGIWGGLSERQRDAIRKRRNLPSPHRPRRVRWFIDAVPQPTI